MKIVKYNDFRNISGKKLREIRISAKLSQQDLAEKLQNELVFIGWLACFKLFI